MKTIILVASLKGADEHGFNEIAKIVRNAAATAHSVEVLPGIILTQGPNGCVNWAFPVQGNEDNIERLSNELHMALQPAKTGWSNDWGNIPAHDSFNL